MLYMMSHNEHDNNVNNNNNNDNNDNDNDNIRQILIIDVPRTSNTTKRINCKKETKMRVETKTWGLDNNELSHTTQVNILHNILDNTLVKTKYNSLILSHIKTKICGYKQQDIFKKKLNELQLVKFEEVILLLNKCEMKCHYCSDQVFVLYERVREMKQWSLDRINNDIGHNTNNVIIACLECNLKRRRTNKDAFMYTKNMVINKHEI